MIQIIRNGVVIFDLAWLVDPFTWTGRIALAIGIPVASKLFLESDFYRNNSPFSKRYNQKLRSEIESNLRDNLPDLDSHQRLQAFPTLSFEGIAKLKDNGNIGFAEGASTSFYVTIAATQKTYQIFNCEALGAGAFGEAFIGQDVSTGAWVAVKMQVLRDTAKEQDVLIENSHLMADGKLLGQAMYEKQGKQYLLSIMPLYVKDCPIHCSASEKIDFLIAVANELKRLHQKNKIHSDLHLGNVCWNKAQGTAHLIDYGSIVNTENLFETTSHYVPKLYTPPESFFGLGLLHVKSSDIYALGYMIRQLFTHSDNARLKSLISSMQHPLFFMRPSLDSIISELTAIKGLASEVEKPIDDSQISRYKLILKQLDNEIAVVKQTKDSNPDYIHLAMLIKEKSIYQKYLDNVLSGLSNASFDDLQKDLKQLVALKSNYQPKIAIVDTRAIKELDDTKDKALLLRFNHSDRNSPALASTNKRQEKGRINKKKVSQVKKQMVK